MITPPSTPPFGAVHSAQCSWSDNTPLTPDVLHTHTSYQVTHSLCCGIIPSPLAYIHIHSSQYGMGIKGLAKLLSDEAPDVRCCTVIRNVFSVLTVVSSNRCLNHLY